MKRKLSIIIDLIICLSFSCLIYILLGGHLRWKILLFRSTMVNIDSPLRFLIFATIIKIAFKLNKGLFAYFLPTLPLGMSSIFFMAHRAILVIVNFLVANRANLICSMIALFFSFAFLEIFLRWLPHTLPYALGNHIASGYNIDISGIYRHSVEMKMWFMRPNYKRTMYYQGYYWHHETDALGFRNPITRASADIVLLGDSMIYGHGVEETSTIRHYLETTVKRPVMNMGIQGGSIHQEYQLLKNFSVHVYPRYVLLFFLMNDIRDLLSYLIDDEMKQFLNLPLEDHTSPYFGIPQNWHQSYDLSSCMRESYTFRAFDFFIKFLSKFLIANVHALDNSWENLPFFQQNPRLILAMRFHLYALKKMHHISRSHNINFMNIFIYTRNVLQNEYPDEEEIYEDIIKRYCQVHEIPFYSLRNDITSALDRGEEIFLPHDGHFSDRGARLVAEILSQFVAR